MVDFEEPFLRLFNQGVILGQDHEKMSKSRGNVVAPDDVVGVLGADAVRCFLMFIGPWDHGGPWSGEGINGIARWLNRVWDIASRDATALDGSGDAAERETERLLHQTVRKCYNDLDKFKFNTAIASLMELTNHLNKVWADSSVSPEMWRECVEKLLLMLAPMAPHLTEELWERPDANTAFTSSPSRRGTRTWPPTRCSRWWCRSTARCATSWKFRWESRKRKRRNWRWPARGFRASYGKAINKTVYVPWPPAQRGGAIVALSEPNGAAPSMALA